MIVVFSHSYGFKYILPLYFGGQVYDSFLILLERCLDEYNFFDLNCASSVEDRSVVIVAFSAFI